MIALILIAVVVLGVVDIEFRFRRLEKKLFGRR